MTPGPVPADVPAPGSAPAPGPVPARGPAPATRGARLLLWWWAGQWRQQPGRALIAVLAIAIGVSLGLAIHLVNNSALDEFGHAMSVVNGQAQAQVLPIGESFEENLFATLAGPAGRAAGITGVSPIIDIRVQAGATDRADPANRTLRLIGLDLYRAARVSPSLLPRVASTIARADGDSGNDSEAGGGSSSPLFGDDTVFLSPQTQQALKVGPGQTLVLHTGTADLRLRVAGDVDGSNAGPGQLLAVMDIGALQWRLNWLGRLNRLDLSLADGVDPGRLAGTLTSVLGREARLQGPDTGVQRMSNLSRAYRVNLSVLSLVALFTGAFIVYSTLALAITRQRASIAMLSILGGSKALVRASVLGQGLLLGLLGGVLGLLAGIGLAWLLLAEVGGDLGGGYFSGSRPPLSLEPIALVVYLLAGVAAGLLGSFWPTLALGRMPAIRLLRGAELQAASASEAALVDRLRTLARNLRWPLLWLAVGGLLLAVPAVEGLPLAAYAAIAAWLFAGIATVPAVVAVLAGLCARVPLAWRWPPLWLAIQRLRVARYAAAGALSGVVASFALASAMVIMVTSFRGSVETWLDRVLPADLYTRSASTGSQGSLDPTLAERLAAVPGVARVELLRVTELSLDPARPAVAILARDIDPQRPDTRLPLASRVLDLPADAAADVAEATADITPGSSAGRAAGTAASTAASTAIGAIPIYVSEAMVDLYGMTPGSLVDLPLGDQRGRFFVRAVWRDYARQFGSIVIDSRHYQALTGDRSFSDAALWLRPGVDASTVIGAIGQSLPDMAALPWRSASDIRALSLRIFDRSFVVTYLLELIAMGVGLFGVAATFAGEAWARSREFGMLRHLGVSRRQVSAQLAIEATLLVLFGVAWGALVGLAIAWVLIARVNPQSFHWTMDVSIPYSTLLISALTLVTLGALTAAIASRRASGLSPIQAVRADW